MENAYFLYQQKPGPDSKNAQPVIVHHLSIRRFLFIVFIEQIGEISLFLLDHSLAERILKQEHIAFPEAIQLFCEGRLEIVGRKVVTR